MSFLLNQLALAFFNLVNSRIDACRILKHKTIAHGINLTAYAIFTGLVIWISKQNLVAAILFSCSAFFNRQLSFDVPLNLRRKLPYYYQSTANPPKAWWDKIENKIFGIADGKKILLFYAAMWVLTIIVYFITVK